MSHYGFRTTLCGLVLLITTITIAQQTAVGQQKELDAKHAAKMAAGIKLFKSEVKPVLVGRCLKCHGGEETEGEFSLADRKALMLGGSQGPAIVIGKSKSSLLYRMITHQTEPTMPEDGAKLDSRNIDAIAKWIDLGAPYDKPLNAAENSVAWTEKQIDADARNFWAFQPLQSVAVPDLKGDQWSQNELDKFVLQALRKKEITPNDPLTKSKLARRLYLSVIGLPPTPEQIEKFLANQDSSAVNELIDELLASQHFGEKWARHWLDVARFAESHGFEQDYDRPHAYHYRDFVIKALNSDMPYQRFVKWQIAGDELNPDEPLAMMATGFLGAGVFPTQLTEKEFEPARYDELDDMTATLGTAMLGLTIGCARCHDHKFDPIPQRDYYRMVSTFTTTIRSEVELELNHGEIKKELAIWKQKLQQLESSLKNYEQEKLVAKFKKWLANGPELKSTKPTWIVLDFASAKSNGGATFTKLPDGSLLAQGKNPDFDSYEFVTRTDLQGITALRIEALAHDSMTRKGPGRASNGNFALGMLSVFARKVGDEKLIPLTLVKPRATFEQNKGNLSVASSIDKNPKTGWAVDPQFGKNHAAIFEFDKPLGFAEPMELVIRMKFDVNNRHSIGRPRISMTTAAAPVSFDGSSERQQLIETIQILEKSKGKPNPQQAKVLLNWFKRSDSQWQQLNQALQAHLSTRPRPKMTKVMISSEGVKPLKHNADGRKFPHFYPQTHFLKRGDAAQKQGIADQGFLQVFSKNGDVSRWQVTPDKQGPLSYRRTTLANWLVDTEHGAGDQLARVIVNRIWQQYFGRGIVATPNDFGFQGARPTHPELLDWLANKLIEENWSLKSIHKLILSSAAFQQSSRFDPVRAAKDPENQWLWRYSPRRLEAELIRDSMLAVSGALDRTMYGKGTLNESMKRRSIYFMIKRSRLIPMMQIFDSPEPLVSVGARPSTTIAPQALLFMNNSNVRNYAKSFARQILSSVDDSAADRLQQIIRAGFRHAVCREPTEQELKRNELFIENQLKSYRLEKQGDAFDLAIADFCQVLFCLNEFIYVD